MTRSPVIQPPFVFTAGQIQGTATNDSAAAGRIGELIPSTVLSGSAVPLVTDTSKTITSIKLTPGDWDLSGEVVFSFGATTNVTQVIGSSSNVNNTVDFTPGKFNLTGFSGAGLIPVGSLSVIIPIAQYSVATDTDVYLIARSSFTVSTTSAYGIIRARRMR